MQWRKPVSYTHLDVYKRQVYVNPKAQFIPPLEFCVGPNPDLEIGQPTDYSFACRTNANFKWDLVKGILPARCV